MCELVTYRRGYNVEWVYRIGSMVESRMAMSMEWGCGCVCVYIYIEVGVRVRMQMIVYLGVNI